MITIKELRNKTGLSQRKFAEKYNLTIWQIQKWEQGTRNTPKSILFMLERLVNEDYTDKPV